MPTKSRVRASTPTAWRLLADIDEAALASLRAARGSARKIARMQAAETGEGIPAARAGGRELPGLVLDLDATLVTCHTEKEQAAPTGERLSDLDDLRARGVLGSRPAAPPSPRRTFGTGGRADEKPSRHSA